MRSERTLVTSPREERPAYTGHDSCLEIEIDLKANLVHGKVGSGDVWSL